MPGARPGRTYLFAFGLILLAAIAVGQTMYDIWAQDGPYTRKTDVKATAPGATTPTLQLGSVGIPRVTDFRAGSGLSVGTAGSVVTYSSTASTGDYLTSSSVTATSPITATPGAGTVAVGFDTTWPPVQGYITTGTLTGGWPVSVAVGGNNEALIGLDPAFSTIISDTLTPSGLHREDPIEIETDTAEATFTLSDAANTSIGLAHAQNTDTGSSAATFTVNDLAADNATVTGQVNAAYLGSSGDVQATGTVSATTVSAPTVSATNVNTANVVATGNIDAAYLGSSGDVQATGTVSAATVSAPTVSATNINASNVTATENVTAAYLGATGEIQTSTALAIEGAGVDDDYDARLEADGLSLSANGGAYAGANLAIDLANIVNYGARLNIGSSNELLLYGGDGAYPHTIYGNPTWEATSGERYNHEFYGSIGNDNRIETTGPLVCDGEILGFYVGTTNSIQTSGTVVADDDVEVGDDIRVTDSITATGHIVSGQQVRAPYLGSSGDVQATGTVSAGTLSAPTISGTNASVANLTATEQVKAMYLGSSGDVQATGTVTANSFTGAGTGLTGIPITAMPPGGSWPALTSDLVVGPLTVNYAADGSDYNSVEIAAPTSGTNRYTLDLAAPSGGTINGSLRSQGYLYLGTGNKCMYEDWPNYWYFKNCNSYRFYGSNRGIHVDVWSRGCKILGYNYTGDSDGFQIQSLSETLTISTLANNKNIVLTPHGTGVVSVSAAQISGSHADGLEISVATASKPLTLTPGSGGRVNVNGSSTLGDGGTTNYTAINATGHQTMAGAATVWDDVTIPGFDVRVAGVSDPAWAKFKDNGAGSTGVFLWWFDPGTLQQVYFTIQLPHKWKEGSAIKPHVHWTPEVTADGAPANQTVEWGLEYTKASPGGDYGNTAIVYAKTHSPADANVVAGRHYITDFADITMSGNTISTILVCRLFRNATDATDDTYEHDAGFLAFDIHVECDSIGSDTDTAK